MSPKIRSFRCRLLYQTSPKTRVSYSDHKLLYLLFDDEVQDTFEKRVRASTRWCIHLRPKIEIYGDQNVR